MLILVHGGQTGVDRGAHDAARDNGWNITGYMPLDGRDELGKIPSEVAAFLLHHHKKGLMARTAANVHMVNAALLVVEHIEAPRATPGTARTLDLAQARKLPWKIADPTTDTAQIARWIWDHLFRPNPLLLQLGWRADVLPRLLVAGPRESKWEGASANTRALLRHVGTALLALQSPNTRQDTAAPPR